MKKSARISLLAFAIASFSLASCTENKPAETTGNTFTEDMVDGVDGGIDSLELNKNKPDTTNTGRSNTSTGI